MAKVDTLDPRQGKNGRIKTVVLSACFACLGKTRFTPPLPRRGPDEHAMLRARRAYPHLDLMSTRRRLHNGHTHTHRATTVVHSTTSLWGVCASLVAVYQV